MTVTAPEISPPPAPSRRRQVPLTPMRTQAAKSMSRLADSMQKSHPDLTVHQHVRDAARMLRAGQEEAAQRHLRAAAFSLTPQSLMRHGLHTDDAHIAARESLHGVHRHLLLVKDIADVAEKNQQQIRRDSYGDDATSNPPPRPADPNAGYGPGALAQKPTARQPGGDKALNAPARTNSGGSDPGAADPDGPQPKGSKQFARTWDDLATVINLVGPHGYSHGWVREGAGSGIVTGPHPADKMTVATDKRAAARSLSDDELGQANQELSRRAAALGKPGQQSKGHKAVLAEMKRRGTGMSVTWDDVARVVELSAKTASLESTPAPYGKPGGPGLYGVSGLKHSDYYEQIVKALMEKRGMDKGRASAIAYGALRKWAHGGGGVHPEVAAAAGGALAKEAAAGARAKAVHGHAVTWDDRALELATVIDLFNPAQPRLPVGPGGGQFAGGGAQSGAQQQPAKGKQQAKAPAKPMTAAQKHAAHVAHVAHLNHVSTAKAGLLVTAQDDKAKASALIKQRDALVKALASAGGKTSSGQAGAKTAATAKTSTTAPAKTTAASTTTAAKASSTAAASTTAKAATTAAKKTTAAATSATSKAASTAQAKAQIVSLNTQISALLKSAAAATAQAAKMK